VRVHDVARLDDALWASLQRADAIVFGAPTYMGSPSAAFKAFAEATSKVWANGMGWRDKLAAGFTNSGAISGDKLNSLVDLAVLAAQHGMLWVGLDLYPGWASSTASRDDLNRLGSWLGAMTQANTDQGPDQAPPASDLATAEHLGRRVAAAAHRWVHGERPALAPA
jgi:NAD(P)H dehydrogenase (quinone)